VSERPNERSSYSPELRRRAAHLAAFAQQIERSLVMTLDDAAPTAGWSTPRAHLCDEMLRRNLHQLHRAADDLRVTAMRFRQRADELDAALEPVA
jgi:hypothetical protein